jgi:hypothetical protein
MVSSVQRGFWIACFVLSFSCRVYAAELHWDVPAACPDVHALEQEAQRVLGGPLAQYPLRVNAVVTPSTSQLELTLRITLPNSAETRERELQAASCQELLEAAAVAIALAAADSGEAAAVAQARDSELANPPVPPSAAEPEPEEAQRSQLALGAAGASNLGALPRLGLGVEFQVAWMRDWLRVALGAAWFPLRSMQLPDSTQASFGMYFFEVLLCGQRRLGDAQLFGCASAGAGRVAAHLDGPEPTLTKSTAWRALGALVGASYPVLPPLELTASLAAWVPLTRPRFYTMPVASEVAHEPTPVVAQLLLGLFFSL